MMNFAGKTAVVTGGSRGIGRAICEELARGGANVVLCYAGRAEAAQETVTACKDLGAKTLRLLTNNPDKVYQLADFGMEIKERVPIQMPATTHDLFYLQTKQNKMGHILNY